MPFHCQLVNNLSLSTAIMMLLAGTMALSSENLPLLENTPPSTPKPTQEHDESLLLNTDLPIFLAEPQNAFIVKNRPALLLCKAAHALRVYFKCNGAKNAVSEEFEFVDPQTGVRIMEAELNVTRDMVEEFFGKDKFKCECHAWSGRGSIRSMPASVEVAFLKKQFEVAPPEILRVENGQHAEVKCIPPQGMPPPRVYWLRGGQILQADTSVLVTSEGHLLIGQARAQDTGNYTCVAENIAAKRMAPTMEIIIYVNGGWSPWSSWSNCDCPGENDLLATGKMQTRTCNNPAPSNGGQSCQGSAVKRTKDCVICPPDEPARWSTWSEWSECNEDCIKVRKRHCIPGTDSTRKACGGKEMQSSPCTSDRCRSMELTRVREANIQNTRSDILLYTGLTTAIFTVCLLSYFVIRLYRNKEQHQSLYNITGNDYHPEFFSEQEKKTLTLQPDLTQTVPSCYEYPHTSIRRSASEHHYDVPHLTSGCDIQMSPATSFTLESSSEKRSQLSGCTNHSDSTYEVATESVTLLPVAYAVTLTTSGNYTNTTVSHSATFLNIPASEVSLFIPEGAIPRRRKQEVFLSILNEDCFRPKLADRLTQISPVISCGPNVSLNKSIILKLPHCADLSKNNWSISVLKSDCNDSQWQNAVTLGKETSNTTLLCQLENDCAYLVTDCLTRFVLVGASTNVNAIKRIKLAVFAPKLCFQTTTDFCVRVYILEDTESSMETVFGQEKRLGGYLLDQPRSMCFQDGGNNLCLSLEILSEGWMSKSNVNYQEVPFGHVWQANSNSLHCSFTLESFEINRNLNFRIRVNQKSSESHSIFDISCPDDELVTNSSIRNEPMQKLPVYTETSRLIMTDRGVSTCEDLTLRLSKKARRQLCYCLDLPVQKRNDWRMLAHALNVDRYLNFFVNKPSPTDCILDLWEARNRNSNALSELRQIFVDMDRQDAVSILENCLGPNWL